MSGGCHALAWRVLVSRSKSTSSTGWVRVAGQTELKQLLRAGGVVSVKANPAHGIPGGINKPFNRMAEIPLAIEDVLEQAKVQLKIGQPSNKLYTT